MATALAPVRAAGTLDVLTRLDALRLALAEPALEFADVASIRNHAELLLAAARAARLGLETANAAREIQLRAERKCGLLLLELMAHRQVMPNGTLAELGISNFQSARFQMLARMDACEFDARIAAIKDAGKELTFAAFVRAARQFVRPRERRTSMTATILHRVLLALREITTLRTPAEVELARQVVAVTRGWEAALRRSAKPLRSDARPDVARTPCCILCGRPRPPTLPPRCLVCGGAWIAGQA